MPRNDGSRCPGRRPSNSFRTPRNCRSAPTVAAVLHAVSTRSSGTSSRAPRIASGAASASSAYSVSFAVVSRLSASGYPSVVAAPIAVPASTNARNTAEEIQIARPARSGAKPSRKPATAPIAPIASTAKSER
jgi:hypothetical protein